MRLLALAALLCASVYAQTASFNCLQIDSKVATFGLCGPSKADLKYWHWSVLAFSAATAADIHSSQGLYEMNPVLGRGPFGGRQAAVKVSITGGLIAAEYFAIRRWPSTEKVFRWVNWLGAAGTAGVAASNYRR